MAEECNLIEITCSLDMGAVNWIEILKQGKFYVISLYALLMIIISW